ncbi:MAG: alpha/beta hydrolase [Parachlamydiales bacterium]|jgi:acetyl esterase
MNSSQISTLDTTTSNFLEGFAKLFASLSVLTLSEQRQTIKEMFALPLEHLEPVAKVVNQTIEGRHGSIAIRLYIPKGEGPLPVLVFYHRGGWVYGSLEESEVICRKLANKTGAIIASVDYRLAPENKFPIPLEDCYDSAKWLWQNAASYNGDAHKILLCGESAGGNLAAAVALMVKQTKEFEVAGQLLIYPILSNDLNSAVYEESPDKALLSYENMQFFWGAYLTSLQDGENPLASPLKASSFEALPSTFIITAEYDALKHEGEKYAKLLRTAGVDVDAKCYPKSIHGFIDLPLDENIKNEALNDISRWIKKITQRQ